MHRRPGLRALALVTGTLLVLHFATPTAAEPEAAEVAAPEATADAPSDANAPVGVETRGGLNPKQKRAGSARKPPPNADGGGATAEPDQLAVPEAKPALRPKRKDSTPDADAQQLAEPRPARRPRRPAADGGGGDAPTGEANTGAAPVRRPLQPGVVLDVDPGEQAPLRRWKPGRLTGGSWETVPPLPLHRMDPNARKPGEEAGYLSPAEQRSARAHVGRKRKQLTNEDGKPIDTGGKEIYVIDPQGNLFISNSKLRQGREQFYHSSFLSGGDVAAAGWIEVKNGKVTYLDNLSGHYKPSVQQLQRAADHLRAQGVSATKMDTVASPQSLLGLPPPPRMPAAEPAAAAP